MFFSRASSGALLNPALPAEAIRETWGEEGSAQSPTVLRSPASRDRAKPSRPLVLGPSTEPRSLVLLFRPRTLPATIEITGLRAVTFVPR
jgi:hypothetical protein